MGMVVQKFVEHKIIVEMGSTKWLICDTSVE